MPRECKGCHWRAVLWCSVRDRLVGTSIALPCIIKKPTVLQGLACVVIVCTLQVLLWVLELWT